MNAYMTNGTLDFLRKIPAKHPDITFWFMSSNSSALAYYEGSKKNVFASGRAFEIIAEAGTMKQKGFVVMNHIPIEDEGKPIFEDAFQKQQRTIETMPGFRAFRLLRPKKGNTYVVLTQWDSEADFNHWKDSDAFKQAHTKQAAMSPAYFADRPFIGKYYMVEDE